MEPEASRQQDRLRGFAHLETFRELYAWTAADVDPLQRANMPLSPRSPIEGPGVGKSNVMLIHDYKGGYLDYEDCQGLTVKDEMYSCEYLQHVETFVYFSHRLVTTPPPSWVNTCHRHGVKVLGTFILEPGTADTQRMLEKRGPEGRFWVAQQLTKIAEAHGFDGWLVNIEKPFPIFSWSAEKLEQFLVQMRTDLGPGGKVVWYDSLTPYNIIWYQNALTSFNLRFALAAGFILTNYAWTPELASESKALAIQNNLPLENVYVGIDVWAQNTQSGQHPRTTWPRDGGGGTGTGLGVKELAQRGLSAGVFGMGWSFEHFGPKHGRTVELAVWFGKALPKALGCECGDAAVVHGSVPYEEHPLIRYARKWSANTKDWFHTDFRPAFTPRVADASDGENELLAHIGAQSPLPHEEQEPVFLCSSGKSEIGTVCLDVSSPPTHRTAKLTLHSTGSSSKVTTITASLQLIRNLSLSRSVPLIFAIRASKPSTPPGLEIAILALDKDGNTVSKISFNHNPQLNLETAVQVASDPSKKIASVTLSIHGTIPKTLTYSPRDTRSSFHLLNLFSISLRPPAQPSYTLGWKITKPRLLQFFSSDQPYTRLAWSPSRTSQDNMQESAAEEESLQTGPFSHFIISLDGKEIGRAYALEFILPPREVETWRKAGKRKVRIEGMAFDGRPATPERRALVEVEEEVRWEAGGSEIDDGEGDDWVLVESVSVE